MNEDTRNPKGSAGLWNMTFHIPTQSMAENQCY